MQLWLRLVRARLIFRRICRVLARRSYGRINGHAHLLHFRQLAHDDFLHAFRRDGLDVGAVGELRVGHDGGRVGVDEDDAVAFFLEGFAGLRAGVIELARLADDEDAVDVCPLGHKAAGNKSNFPPLVSDLIRAAERESRGGIHGAFAGLVFGFSGARCASPVIGTKRTGSTARFSSLSPCLRSSTNS